MVLLKAPSLWPIPQNDNISQLVLLLQHSPNMYYRLGLELGVRHREKNKGETNQFCFVEEALGSILFELVLEDMNSASTGLGVGMEY